MSELIDITRRRNESHRQWIRRLHDEHYERKFAEEDALERERLALNTTKPKK